MAQAYGHCKTLPIDRFRMFGSIQSVLFGAVAEVDFARVRAYAGLGEA
jgi:hypothetical protein